MPAGNLYPDATHQHKIWYRAAKSFNRPEIPSSSAEGRTGKPPRKSFALRVRLQMNRMLSSPSSTFGRSIMSRDDRVPAGLAKILI